MTPENPNLMTDAEFARFIGKSRETTKRMRRDWRGPPFIRVGQSVFYDRHDVGKWLQESRIRPALFPGVRVEPRPEYEPADATL